MLKPFEHGQELSEKTKRLEYVNAQLSGNSQSINNAPESAVEFRFHNNKYQALIGTKDKSEWCDVVSKGGKLIAASDTIREKMEGNKLPWQWQNVLPQVSL